MRRGGAHIDWEGRTVRAREGEAIGRVLRTHDPDADGWPETLVVDLGAHNLGLPARDAVLTRDDVRLPWTRRRLDEARPLDAEAHDDAAAVGRAAEAFENPSRTAIGEDPHAMTLSEERLDVHVEAVPVERVALRKRLVEETVSVPVTVRREVVEMVREPLMTAADNAPTVPPGEEPDTAPTVPLGQAPPAVEEGVAAEVVLYEERPVVGVEVVPVERVRLVKTFATDEVVIADAVRHEEATVDRLPPAG